MKSGTLVILSSFTNSEYLHDANHSKVERNSTDLLLILQLLTVDMIYNGIEGLKCIWISIALIFCFLKSEILRLSRQRCAFGNEDWKTERMKYGLLSFYPKTQILMDTAKCLRKRQFKVYNTEKGNGWLGNVSV